jgi:hypothetical protein
MFAISPAGRLLGAREARGRSGGPRGGLTRAKFCATRGGVPGAGRGAPRDHPRPRGAPTGGGYPPGPCRPADASAADGPGVSLRGCGWCHAKRSEYQRFRHERGSPSDVPSARSTRLGSLSRAGESRVAAPREAFPWQTGPLPERYAHTFAIRIRPSG